MAYVNLDLPSLQKQFYSREVNFNYFKGLTDKDIKELSAKAQIRNERLKERIGFPNYIKLENYISVLRYLNNAKTSIDLDSFDKKILFFVLSVDPEFKAYDLYLKSRIVPIQEIELSTGIQQYYAIETSKRAFKDYQSKVQEELGFYDSELLKYESLLKQTIMKDNHFLNGVNIPSKRSITRKADTIEDLNFINPMRLEAIKKLVERWYTEATDPSDLNSLAYNILNNKEVIPFLSDQEQVLLFTLVGDPDLKLLSIYEEESTQQKISERALNEVGFYSKGMINFEKLYHKQFEPEKQISSWTK